MEGGSSYIQIPTQESSGVDITVLLSHSTDDAAEVKLEEPRS